MNDKYVFLPFSAVQYIGCGSVAAGKIAAYIPEICCGARSTASKARVGWYSVASHMPTIVL